VRLLDSVIGGTNRNKLNQYLKDRSRTLSLKRELKQRKSSLRDLSSVCLKHIEPVTSPIALISQIQRSGGTLLSQLFDGHPELHAHPNELMIGYPKKHVWPKIDINERPERWFEVLFEDMVIQHLREGYKKDKKHNETFPFIFLPSLQRKIFLEYAGSIEPITLRDVFDAYMTSYFGAWVNNQNSGGVKKYVTAFTPRLAMYEESLEAFFEVYPDGRLVSTVRNPANWYPSAVRHGPKRYGRIRNALDQWKESCQAMIKNKERYGDRVSLIRFEDLIENTEKVMRYLAEMLQIHFDNILLIPTFNKSAIKANTSFTSEQYGIINSTLSRHKTLGEDELEVIEAMTGEDYQRVLKEVATL
jgi:hypothetical protein